jgi:hypothetical protein
MDQVPNRTNVQMDPRTMVVDPRVGEKKTIQEHRPKKSEDLVTSDSHQIFGLDKNLLLTFAVVGVSLMFSMYLFREVKKLRDDVRTIKAQEPDQDILDKVEENSEAVKAIENKLDQLITALGARERRMQQMAQQIQQTQPVPQQQTITPQQQQIMMQQQQAQQQMMQPPQVTEQEYQNQQIMQQQQIEAQQMNQQMNQQVPVMNGRLAGSAGDDPGIIRI